MAPKGVISMSVDVVAAESRADAGRDLRERLETLPQESRSAFIDELIEAALEQQATGNGDRLKYALLSLEISPAVHAAPGYASGLDAADRDVSKETVDLGEYVTGLRGRRPHPPR